ncbi:COG0795 Predicted permeases [Candidatus Methylopumilus planktonicus]|jgi:lipopolysaccharide export system permease protein|uniref:LPS export ABC transporter permease LptG n=1 Tax=Candidatus Methylopumilus planktonicus TaxID=1581557 RepID=UPI003B9B2054
MKILYRYLNLELAIPIFWIMIGLIGILSFFDFIQEINDLGKGTYNLLSIFSYVVLSIPGHVYEIVPIAVLIGSMYAIGQLSENSELTVIRSSGYSIKHIAFTLSFTGLFFTLFTFAVGDLVTPLTEKKAQEIRITAKESIVTQEFRSGLWIKDSNSFINVEHVLPDTSLSNIHIYEFDNNFHLRTITNAKKGSFKESEWKLEDVDQTIFNQDKISTNSLKSANWKSLIKPEMMNVLLVSPEKMSSMGLIHFIKYLKNNRQKVTRYEIALWEKLIYPLASIAMVLFAIPFGFFQERSGGKNVKIFLGILFGIFYQIMNSGFRYIGLLNDWHPLSCAAIPTLIFFSIGVMMIYKTEHR